MSDAGNTSMTWDWVKGNIPTIIAIGGLFWYTAQDNANIKAHLDENDRYKTTRSAQTDKNFADVNSALKNMSDLPYRMGAQEGKTQALNDRVDRLADAILGSQEAIRKDIAGLSTKVEVLGSKIDTFSEKPQAGSLRPK